MFAERIWRWLGGLTTADLDHLDSRLKAAAILMERHQLRIEDLERQIRKINPGLPEAIAPLLDRPPATAVGEPRTGNDTTST